MIDRAEALFYHAELIRRFGGSHGVRDEGILDASLNRPFATFGGQDLFPEALDKAAAVMHGIITGHPFLDGNKRTGYALGRLLLQEAGLDIEAEENDRYDMVIGAATGQLDVDGIRAWMATRVVPFLSR